MRSRLHISLPINWGQISKSKAKCLVFKEPRWLYKLQQTVDAECTSQEEKESFWAPKEVQYAVKNVPYIMEDYIIKVVNSFKGMQACGQFSYSKVSEYNENDITYMYIYIYLFIYDLGWD